MTLKPPVPNITPKFDEELTSKRLTEILMGIQQNFDFLMGQFPIHQANFANRPCCRVYKAAGQEVKTGTLTALTFDSERFDVGGLHSPSTNPTRLTAPMDGVYVISGSHSMEAKGGAASHYAEILLNGVAVIAPQRITPSAGGFAESTLTTTYKLKAGEYVELRVYQESGGAINTAAVNFQTPQEFSMAWLEAG